MGKKVMNRKASDNKYRTGLLYMRFRLGNSWCIGIQLGRITEKNGIMGGLS